MTTSSQYSWREIVEAADDKDRHYESLHPVVYTFGGTVQKRDSGPTSGVYEQP